MRLRGPHPTLFGFVTVWLMLAAAAPMAQAQGVANTFQELRLLVKPGDTITVSDSTGLRITGKLADLSASSLGLLVDGRRRDLSESDVATIQQRRGDSLGNGALWGFGVGAGLGLAGGLAVAAGDGVSPLVIPLVALFYGGIGSGIGVGVDAMIARQQVIYEKPRAATARVAVVPLLTRDLKAVRLSLRF